MLTEAIRPDGKKVTMTYDPLGRRVSKSMGGIETRWIWSGNTVLHELKTGQPNITWYHEPDGLAPLAKSVGDQTYSIVADHLGTPTAMYDDTGKLAWRMQLDLFGVPKEESSKDRETCPWRWSGQYDDHEIGLYYNRFRYYDPTLGQYISQDPIQLEGGLAFYSYVYDPAGWIDPTGLAGCGPSAQARFDAAIIRHGGKTLSPLSAQFPNRRSARQAASELVGNMGPFPRSLRQSDFRGTPKELRMSERVIGKQRNKPPAEWRDDVLGHPRFGAGPHVNVTVDGLDFHLYY